MARLSLGSRFITGSNQINKKSAFVKSSDSLNFIASLNLLSNSAAKILRESVSSHRIRAVCITQVGEWIALSLQYFFQYFSTDSFPILDSFS